MKKVELNYIFLVSCFSRIPSCFPTYHHKASDVAIHDQMGTHELSEVLPLWTGPSVTPNALLCVTSEPSASTCNVGL